MIDAIGKRDRNLANAYSVSVAKVGLSFIGGDKVKLEDFLPFAVDEPTQVDKPKNPSNSITAKTARDFRAALKSGFIPNRMVGACFKYMDDIERLTRE
jgi:hypothetical protein